MDIQRHKISSRTPKIIFSVLIFLTVLTVLATNLVLGDTGALVLALFIASTKAALILTFFMHLNHEPLIFKLFLGIAFLTLLSIFVLTFSDYAFRGLS